MADASNTTKPNHTPDRQWSPGDEQRYQKVLACYRRLLDDGIEPARAAVLVMAWSTEYAADAD
ncbi:MAG: hypothetical protein LPK43_03820 [Gammaproteobacteria bacterium]|nr:hypothetical protein [Gammaproteobacteria bacterium]